MQTSRKAEGTRFLFAKEVDRIVDVQKPRQIERSREKIGGQLRALETQPGENRRRAAKYLESEATAARSVLQPRQRHGRTSAQSDIRILTHVSSRGGTPDTSVVPPASCC